MGKKRHRAGTKQGGQFKSSPQPSQHSGTKLYLVPAGKPIDDDERHKRNMTRARQAMRTAAASYKRVAKDCRRVVRELNAHAKNNAGDDTDLQRNVSEVRRWMQVKERHATDTQDMFEALYQIEHGVTRKEARYAAHEVMRRNAPNEEELPTEEDDPLERLEKILVASTQDLQSISNEWSEKQHDMWDEIRERYPPNSGPYTPDTELYRLKEEAWDVMNLEITRHIDAKYSYEYGYEMATGCEREDARRKTCEITGEEYVPPKQPDPGAGGIPLDYNPPPITADGFAW